jgi:hypothetical protein
MRAAKRTNSGKAARDAFVLQPVATLRILHGKEGVDGSSPSEGLSGIQK